MVNQFFKYRPTLERLHDGPLGRYVDAFAAWLSTRGYTRRTVMSRIRLVGAVSRWLRRRRLGVGDLDEQTTAEFLKCRRRKHRTRNEDVPTLRLLLEHLRELGVIPLHPPEVDQSELGCVECNFSQYLRQERALSEGTVMNYVRVVRCFLSERFGKGTVTLEELHPCDVTRFALRYALAARASYSTVMAPGLRAFFRFLHLRGDTPTNLVACVPAAAGCEKSTLPKFLKTEQVERLLKSCDQGTDVGRRDYAVLLLLARLGLRAGEVGTMMLDDIHWEIGTLRVRGKGGREDLLPIPQDVGESLVKYLRYVRPRCSTRRVFVRMLAPHAGFRGSQAICQIVARALARAGLDPPHKGAHILRHSLATDMLRKGASLDEIGEILRHRSRCSTEIYAKVDFEALRTVAQHWPGGIA